MTETSHPYASHVRVRLPTTDSTFSAEDIPYPFRMSVTIVANTLSFPFWSSELLSF